MDIVVVGTGEVQNDRLTQLVLADAASALGADLGHIVFPSEITSDSMAAAYRWAQDYDIPIAIDVFDQNYKLYVFVDPDNPQLQRLMEKALDAGIEVWDICNAGTRLSRLPTMKENEMPTPKAAATAATVNVYPRATLEAYVLDDDEDSLIKAAQEYGVDYESAGTWDEVVEAILEAQGGEGAEDEEGGEGGEDEGEVFTQESLEAIAEGDGTPAGQRAGLEELKEIAKAAGITVPGQRPRRATYIQAILDYQNGADGDDDGEDAGAEDTGEEGTQEMEFSEIAAMIVEPLKVEIAEVKGILAEVLGFLTKLSAKPAPAPAVAAVPAAKAAKAVAKAPAAAARSNGPVGRPVGRPAAAPVRKIAGPRK